MLGMHCWSAEGMTIVRPSYALGLHPVVGQPAYHAAMPCSVLCEFLQRAAKGYCQIQRLCAVAVVETVLLTERP